jgi:O-antigen ligase
MQALLLGFSTKAVYLAVLTLPFMQALTLNLGWPIKIYEVTLAVAIIFWLAGALKIPVAWQYRKEMGLLLAFACWVFLSSLINIVVRSQFTLDLSTLSSRFGPFGDSMTKVAYIIFIVIAFSLILRISLINSEKVASYWLIGGVISALYGWYLFASSSLGLSPFLLPGIDDPQYFSLGLVNFPIIRSGTFLEGNFAGLFLLQSASLAFHYKRRKLAFFFLASVITTLSTVSILAMTMYGTLVFIEKLREARIAKKIAMITICAAIIVPASVASLSSPLVNAILIQKITASTNDSPLGLSREERSTQSLTGLKMFAHNPILGVGISQYGFYYNQFKEDGDIIRNSSNKKIANNVYVELLAETGIVGFIIFAVFVLRVIAASLNPELVHLRSGLFITLLCFLAFPSFSVLYVWVFFALILSNHIKNDSNRHPPETRMLTES